MWLYGLAFAVFGILIPWQKGLDMLDPLLFLAYATLALIVTGPLALRLEPIRAAAIGWGAAMVTLLLAVITVNATHHYGTTVLPLRPLVLAATLLSLSGSIAIAGLCAVLRERTQAPRAVLRGILLALLLAFVAYQRLYPDLLASSLTAAGLTRLTWIGTPLLLGAGGALLWWARRQPLTASAADG